MDTNDSAVVIAIVTAVSAIAVALINKPRPEREPPTPSPARTVRERETIVRPSFAPTVTGANRFDKIVLSYAILSAISVIICSLLLETDSMAESVILLFLLLNLINAVMFFYLLVRLIIERCRKRINIISMIICILSFYIIYLILSNKT